MKRNTRSGTYDFEEGAVVNRPPSDLSSTSLYSRAVRAGRRHMRLVRALRLLLVALLIGGTAIWRHAASADQAPAAGGAGPLVVKAGGFVQTTTVGLQAAALAGSTRTTTITTTIQARKTALANGIVDIEVYNATNQRVGQQYFAGQSIALGQSQSYTYPWSGTVGGTYHVAVGVYGSGWAPTYLWVSNAASFTLNDPAPTATGSNTPPPPSATSTSTAVPATTTSTSTPVPPTTTNTPVPPTVTGTNTAVPATGTSTSTPMPASPTRTNTAVPATATSTSTPVPPTATTKATASATASSATGTTTLGYTQVGTSIDKGCNQTLDGYQITTGSSGSTAISVSVYATNVAAAPANEFQVGLYTDGGGHPATLVAAGAIGSLVEGGWATATLAATLAPNTTYWLMYNGNGQNYTNNYLRLDGDPNEPQTIGAYYSGRIAFGSMPASMPATTLGPWEYSMYLTLAGGSAPTSTETPAPPSATSTSVPPTITSTALPATSTSTSTAVPPTSTSTVQASSATATATATPPAATSTATAVPPTSTNTPTPAGGPAFPLKASADGHYLVDQRGAPFLIKGDSPWALPYNLSTADAQSYLAQRSAQGFNTVLLTAFDNTYGNGRSDFSTYDGILPFAGAVAGGYPDLSTPNPTYWARLDTDIQAASTLGLAVLIVPLDAGEFGQGTLPALEANGMTQAYNYGVFLGNRYKAYPNVMYASGVDFRSWNDKTLHNGATDDQLIEAVERGIASVDPGAVQTVELNPQNSSSTDDPSQSPPVDLSWVYDYWPQYDYMDREFGRVSSTHMPYFLGEANYEGENDTGRDPSTPLVLRKQEYWTALSGATGQMFGNHYTWGMFSGWQNNVATVGAAQFRVMANLIASQPWQGFVPDIAHTVMTAGYGTYSATGGQSITNNDYATTARTSDGRHVVSYIPTTRTVTYDLSQLAGPVTAQWFDPTNGSYTAVAGSPFPNAGSLQFTPPGANNGGDHDWVLVLSAG